LVLATARAPLQLERVPLQILNPATARLDPIPHPHGSEVRIVNPIESSHPAAKGLHPSIEAVSTIPALLGPVDGCYKLTQSDPQLADAPPQIRPDGLEGRPTNLSNL
jgi:hypothetical protein